jgi:serine/threonine protein phosphatase PrpC
LIHNVNSIIEDTFLDINYKLQTSDSIDTTFSGSTCASLIFTPEKILTANVGDSRAVLGRCVNGGKLFFLI